ncbi:putative ABC-type transport system, permease component [Sphaerochaeta pleomorpha str. Grapes]|uniref:Putative ABC-type transport system, permease component n=1 Tax=Sphaerochaeta pleomorpha (strain ATCC BAA-1885 / DSM 22778 / Grapes) TaxID=158190 RepID=G8QUU7_SPHPG|nr:ABC transporter permease [Sphaerochaeta pleomorpha]AEV28123.1 putative ABC-type transport system, permease component [Sphaerochaeta pleomorpha str. Grapes]
MNSIIIDGLSFSLPLFIIALGGIYCEGSGVINLALEGLLGFGAFFGGLSFALLSATFLGNSPSLIYLSLFFAMFGGALFAGLHGLMCIKFKANQVISGVVINMLSVSLTAFFANQINASVFGHASNKFQLEIFPRVTIPFISKIPVLGAFSTNMYTFEFIIVIVALFMWYLLYKTPAGMRLRACGDNPHAVAASGGNVNKIRFWAIIASGAMAGLGGMCFAYSISTNFSPSIYMGFGYLAIAAYIFGNWKIGPTFLACILFGFARSAGYVIVQKLQLPSSYSDLVLTLPYILTLVLLIFFSSANKPPLSLGEIYDQSKR